MVERSLPGGETTSGPSEKATLAFAKQRFYRETTATGRDTGRWDRTSDEVRESWLRGAAEELAPAHDPKLGEDRSVRLGDVVDWLRGQGEAAPPLSGERGRYWVIADEIAREFGGSADGV